MDKKITVWLDNSPGGFAWTLKRNDISHVYGTKQSDDFVKAVITIHTTKKVSKKKGKK